MVQCGPSQHRADPGGQLLEAERLRHVVVAAEGEPANLVVGGVAGGEEDDRGAHAALAQPPDHLEAVKIGKHHVEHHEVGRGLPGRGHRLGTVGRRGDIEAGEAQARREQLDDVGIVLDYEQLRTSLRPLLPGVRADGAPGLHRSASNTHDLILRRTSWPRLSFL